MIISNDNTFRVLFDNTASVYFIRKTTLIRYHWKWSAQGTSTVPIVSAHFRFLYKAQTSSEFLHLLLLKAVKCKRHVILKVKVHHTRLSSLGFRSWSRFLVVSLQVMWVINPAVCCNYFPPSLQLPSQPIRWLWTVCLRMLPDSVAAAIWS